MNSFVIKQTRMLAILLFLLTCGMQRVLAEDLYPIEPPDTSSPRATLLSFINSCNKIHEIINDEHAAYRGNPKAIPAAKRILNCLDDSDLAGFSRIYAAGEAAICLKEVIDRVELPPFEDIPDKDDIKSDEGGVLKHWRIPRTPITISLMEEGPRQGAYLFSKQTLAEAADYYQDMQHLPYRTTGPAVSKNLYTWYFSEAGTPALDWLIDRCPNWVRHRYYGLSIWQWVGLIINFIVAAALMILFYKLGKWQPVHSGKHSILYNCLRFVFLILAILVPLEAKYIVANQLAVRGQPLYISSFFCDVTALLAVMFGIMGLGSRVAEIMIASPHINPKGLDAQFIRIISKVVSLSIAVIVFLEGGKYLGIPLTTLLASAGVGGIAVALATQDMLKNLFGSMMILFDKPYRVGERIIVRNYDGVVEEIGLRSTRVRLLTGNAVTIPNEEMARAEIENVGRRPHIRRLTDIQIPLYTAREKITKAVQIIREILKDHEGNNPDFPPRVYFSDITAEAFVIRMIYWYSPPNYWDFMAFSERVNLEIFQAFEAEQIEFKLPSKISLANSDSKPPTDAESSTPLNEEFSKQMAK